MAEIKRIATRQAYGETLAKLGAEYPGLVVMDADLSKSTKTDLFQKAFPERHINCGIAESNMMAAAAGIALTGKIVFASTFAMFAAGRAFEQVRTSIGYTHANVKIGATHAGLSVGEDGATHQCCEDIALMRTIPGMTVISPADAVEARAAVRAAAAYKGPVYLRFGRLPVPVVFNEGDYVFTIGKGYPLREGHDVTLAATGLMVEQALVAADLLAGEGIHARVLDIPTIKPIDDDLLAAAARETGAIVTAEEHNIIGGLGGAVCESVSASCPVPVLRVGVEDTFGRSGPALEVLRYYGLTAEHLVEKAKAAIALKTR
ncbi:transketolase family protein [Ethanoligenens harbinense]|uniref:Transketolase central region n=1 Tax=Ethanoligenens harbinense (strain DSM 18485 / JCM 12961 / CGMCC 1.5033 / YUAN-3) TaxID=663278 RepID=E6U2I4_ETHHY|nr:transketolase family protein [Ethanoligenens harbinense]ADU26275.1 Transketolase central region [Ethanoligenens harbinense YUAN-3]AVQ95409.1 transketolase [Ethanoligenens harbinense YUAN-3]AYF38074.1 transketolase [Ethanoligenens harbinense]AYF40819.1 transketolase [Ethanoligenens harbinense]QCN91650.1 transketolase family protein [Ethanoligenens harbinense]